MDPTKSGQHTFTRTPLLAVVGIGTLALCLWWGMGGAGGASGVLPAGFVDPDESLSGGDLTVSITSVGAFGRPAPDLPIKRADRFIVGNSFFNRKWVTAPASTSGHDGLGPLFNASSCKGCHKRDGRGRPPMKPGEMTRSLLIRLSVPGKAPNGGPNPDPVYGDQVQNRATLGIPPEADIEVTYTEVPGTFADGTPYSLRKPTYKLVAPAYGPFHDDLMTSPRVAPAVFGLGLLAAIPDATLLAMADPEDEDGDGISGRVNRVADVKSGGRAIGRFGWKAGQPTIEQQVSAAFIGDIGLTTPMFMEENFTVSQTAAAKAPNGGKPEIGQRIVDFIVHYQHLIAVPARRGVDEPKVRRGRRIFFELGCVSCHKPRLETGESPDFPELSNQTIRPFTDLLLHDMGPGLADGRPEFAASGTEWRTPPLWGIGLVETVSGHTLFLHDGRARNLTEAILWHGGEAQAAQEGFRNLDADERAALIAFLESL